MLQQSIGREREGGSVKEEEVEPRPPQTCKFSFLASSARPYVDNRNRTHTIQFVWWMKIWLRDDIRSALPKCLVAMAAICVHLDEWDPHSGFTNSLSRYRYRKYRVSILAERVSLATSSGERDLMFNSINIASSFQCIQVALQINQMLLNRLRLRKNTALQQEMMSWRFWARRDMAC